VDSLFPRRDEHPIPGQPEWIRSVSGGGPRRGTDTIPLPHDLSRSVLIRVSIQNQMQDAMTIWDSICHSQWFKSTSIVGELSSTLTRLYTLTVSDDNR